MSWFDPGPALRVSGPYFGGGESGGPGPTVSPVDPEGPEDRATCLKCEALTLKVEELATKMDEVEAQAGAEVNLHWQGVLQRETERLERDLEEAREAVAALADAMGGIEAEVNRLVRSKAEAVTRAFLREVLDNPSGSLVGDLLMRLKNIDHGTMKGAVKVEVHPEDAAQVVELLGDALPLVERASVGRGGFRILLEDRAVDATIPRLKARLTEELERVESQALGDDGIPE